MSISGKDSILKRIKWKIKINIKDHSENPVLLVSDTRDLKDEKL